MFTDSLKQAEKVRSSQKSPIGKTMTEKSMWAIGNFFKELTKILETMNMN